MTDINKDNVIADFADVLPRYTDFVSLAGKQTGTIAYSKRQDATAFNIKKHIGYVTEPLAVLGIDNFFFSQFVKGKLFHCDATFFVKMVDFCQKLLYNALILELCADILNTVYAQTSELLPERKKMDTNTTTTPALDSKEAPVRVLLLGIYASAEDQSACDTSLAELKQLAETSLGESAENAEFFCMTQCRRAPEAATYLGAGKAEEAAQLCRDHDIALAVFDAELSPSQIKNLEDILNRYFQDSPDHHVRLIDRTMLILDIFAKHAVTGEGKLQVEIAQLRYTSPRLTGKGTALSRQGGTSGSIGARGPGETKLETDRRHIQHRIQTLRAELAEMEKERGVKRTKRLRSGIPTVAIVGYTNAGKSTLLNYLTGAGILAENKLFATLDPTVRKLTLPSGREVLLSDTVGFINKLPHGLVEAFKSTLDEVRYADILLLLTDASDPEAEMKTRVTEQILTELDAAGKPILYVFNKADLADTLPPKALMRERRAVSICAVSGEGVPELLEMLDEVLRESKQELTFCFPFDAQAALNTLYKSATVERVEYTDKGAVVTALVSPKEAGMYAAFIVQS